MRMRRAWGSESHVPNEMNAGMPVHQIMSLYQLETVCISCIVIVRWRSRGEVLCFKLARAIGNRAVEGAEA